MNTPITRNELFDINTLQNLVTSDAVKSVDKMNLQKYRRRSRLSGNNKVIVTYDFPKSWATIQKGRLIPQPYALSQCSFPSQIGAALGQKYYWDIDMKNCQPTLAIQVAKRYGFSTPALEEYCQHRDAIFSEMIEKTNMNRDEVKTEWIRVMFGGTSFAHPLIPKVKKELTTLAAVVKQDNLDIYNNVLKLKEEKKKNSDPLFSCLAIYLQNEERLCLMAFIEYAQSIGRYVGVLKYDGGQLEKSENESSVSKDILLGAQKAILEKTGYSMALEVKPLVHSFDFSSSGKLIAPDILINDDFAAKKFASLAGNFIKKVNDTLYAFNSDTGLWTETLSPLIHEYKDALVFRQMGPSGIKTYDYGGKKVNIDPMLSFVKNYVPESKLDPETSIGKLLWSNGYYDFDTDTFHDEFNPEIHFVSRISRPFPKQRDEATIRHVHKILFEDPYLEEQAEQRDFYKIAIARAIYGDYRAKRCYFTTGEPNCGRGLLTAALQSAFESYVTQFSSEQLLYNPRVSTDPAKQMAWCIPFKDVRIAIANEISMSGKFIDGNRLKGLSGGGDQIQARLNFKDESLHTIRATLFCLTNDIPAIKPVEKGLLNRICINELLKSYVQSPDPSNKYQALEDRSLKTKFESESYKDAVFFILVDEWKRFVAANKISEKPALVASGIQEWVETGSTIKDILEEKYQITKNENHWVRCSDLLRHLKSKDCKESDTKIGRELSRLTCHGPKTQKIDGRAVKVRLGIRLIGDDPNDDEGPLIEDS